MPSRERRGTAQVRAPALTEGKWFLRWSFWIVPKACERQFLHAIRRLNAERQELKLIAEDERADQLAQDVSLPARQRAQALLKSLELNLELMAREQTAVYNLQPLWGLADVGAGSVGEAKEVICEFLDFIPYTHNHFWWPDLSEDLHWHKHGWKHIDYDCVRSFAEDVHRREWPPPQIRMGLLGSDEAAKEVFLKAAERDPEAVARLSHLFPVRGDMLDAAEDILADTISKETLLAIPSAAELASECVSIIVDAPDSKSAYQARKALKLLASPRASKGANRQIGRPRAQLDQQATKLTYQMSQALFQQVRQVEELLAEFDWEEVRRASFLLQYYPWLREIERRDSLLGLVRTQPSHAAYALAGYLLEVSPSKIKQMV